ncbi:sigma-70 family RNA polymerase sigma factor [Streptomyces sp. NPDC008125]|uniref:RNA polymerase sigma factor n=1 Tax=Streptomyces sp. NPDC008125 TaxID=3364811 RepID=UPI0036EF76F7
MKPLLPRHGEPLRSLAPAVPLPRDVAVPPLAPLEPLDEDATLNLRDADREVAIAHIYDHHYTGLVRLAVLLGAEQDAEDLVSEAFCQLHYRWAKLKTPEAAASYLRSIVCNLARMRIRRIRVVRRHTYRVPEDLVRSAEQQVLLNQDQRELVAALGTLSSRQRQVLVLKYWLDLKETEIAETMKISVGAVKSHTARGMAKLTSVMKGAAG